MTLLDHSQDPVSKLVFELSKLPSIGEKTATRLAYYIIKQEPSYSQALSEAILNVKQKILLCQSCLTFTSDSLCKICSHPDRNFESICIVERPSDVTSIEQATHYRGVYHVLHGVLSPLDGIGPEDLKIQELLKRIQEKPPEEIIIATNPTVEGDATALYINKLLKPLKIKTTKFAHGLPVGGRLEFSDQQTISKAMENRMELL